MPTTFPNTTRQSTIPTGTIATSCQTSIPDYKTLRQENFGSINDYYNNLLDTYTKSYTDYTTQKNSPNVNDRAYAETTLKPKVTDYNNQLIAISKAVIDSVDQDTDLIIEQKNQLQEKTSKVETLTNEIKMLKDKDDELLIVSNSREDSLNSTKTGTEDKQFTAYIYIGINILLVCLVIGFVFYLVYSNYATNPSNTVNNAPRTNVKNNVRTNVRNNIKL
jgi:hypothetical protein